MPLRYALVSVLIMLADQVTKALIRRDLALHETHEIIPGFLSLLHGRNRGLAFGLLSRDPLPWQSVLLTVLSGAVIVGLVLSWRALSAGHTGPQTALSLIVGGALGNLVDRVRLGYVTDFVHVYWRRWDWPDFNVGDAAISTGIALLVLDSLLTWRATRQGPAAARPTAESRTGA